ncbi:MAG: hypothetical protein DMD47_03420 [Gemmatimonadetes bacterium]|nr:MAG: hypothetical protein DMD47_03420 [Gemmatimonadota bacterium]
MGALTAAAVVLFLVVARFVPGTGGARRGMETLIVLAAGVLASFLPGRWAAARHAEGIAGAAAIGLWGTIVFMAFDIVLLRPFRAYPWTWDAIGGGSSWWYLPIWWMLGTFLAWMGGIVTATQAARGEATLTRTAGPAVVGAVLLVIVARLAGLQLALPVQTGAGFTIALAVLAVVALARKS